MDKRRRVGIVVIVVSAILAASCGGDTPVSPRPAAPLAVPVTEGTSLASLEISELSVRLHDIVYGDYIYRPSLRLTETGGRSAATLKSIQFNEHTFGFPLRCSVVSSVIEAGSTSDVAAGYVPCLTIDAPESLSGTEVEVTVHFRDQDGRAGTAKARTRIE